MEIVSFTPVKYQESTYSISPEIGDGSHSTIKQYNSGSGILDEVDLTSMGERIRIPRSHIYGSQTRRQYTFSTLEYLKGVMKADPVGFLEKAPPVVCILYNEKPNTVEFIALNGHHRIRESGKFHDAEGKKIVNAIPAIVLTPEEYVDICRKLGDTPNLTPESFIGCLRQKQSETLTSFNRECSSQIKWNPKPARFVDYLKYKTF